jgi:hypothetical protein
MTAEELLKPRFEVIADFPLLKNKVGEIIIAKKPYWRIELDFLFLNSSNISPEAYPHLFRKLNWWEHRKIEDMPKKVGIKETNETYEIISWEFREYNVIGHFNKNNQNHDGIIISDAIIPID